MSKLEDLHRIRQEYGTLELLEADLPENPISQFEDWFAQHLLIEKETPNSMVISTSDSNGYPDSRVVLLKELDKGAFVFYTNKYSAKGLQLANNPHVALNFYWPKLMRQVRVRGVAHQVGKQQADDYFHSRPTASQLSAIASPQSVEINSRDELDEAFTLTTAEYANKKIICPDSWAGYAVVPNEIEFWQGRDSRLHDRIQYYRNKDTWCHRRLAP